MAVYPVRCDSLLDIPASARVAYVTSVDTLEVARVFGSRPTGGNGYYLAYLEPEYYGMEWVLICHEPPRAGAANELCAFWALPVPGTDRYQVKAGPVVEGYAAFVEVIHELGCQYYVYVDKVYKVLEYGR